MLELLERQRTLTGHQRLIVFAAIIADVLEFFDYFLIGFVLPIITKTWHLNFAEGATVFLASGIGGLVGAYFWGYLADRIGRRVVFMATVLTFSISTGLMALTPENSWLYLSICRIGVGFGFGGLYAVDLALVQEFMPTARRGFISGMVTVFIPLGTVLGGLLGASLSPSIGWRGLFLLGLIPAAFTLVIRTWVPESPRWLLQRGRVDEARRSLAWALEVPVDRVELPTGTAPVQRTRWVELFRYPKSLTVSWFGNLGMQTGAYGIVLWYPTLLYVVLKSHNPSVTVETALYFSVAVSLGGLAGRFLFSYLSEKIGRRPSCVLACAGAAICVFCTALFARNFIGAISVFWLMLILSNVFVDGGFAVVSPYSAEVWPARLRASGMGSAYGFGGFGKIIGPLALALIVGASNPINPAASLVGLVGAFAFLSAAYIFGALVFGVLGFETRGRSIEEIDRDMTPATPSVVSLD